VPQIAFVGLGRMGLPMCAALVSAGYQVTATDKRAEAEQAAVACGAIWQDTPAQAAAAAGVLITMLPGPREVQAVMLGEVHTGGHGTGYTAKLLVNLLWFGQAIATAEALLLGQRAGIDPAVLEHALAGSSAASAFIRRDMGLVFQGDYMTSFGLDMICEELEAVTALAGDYHVPWELSDLVRRTYRRALARYGPVDGELLAVALLEEEAGHKLCPRNS